MSTFFETDSVISLRNMARKTGDLSKLSFISSQHRPEKASHTRIPRLASTLSERKWRIFIQCHRPGMCIPDPDFFPYPGSRNQQQKRGVKKHKNKLFNLFNVAANLPNLKLFYFWSGAEKDWSQLTKIWVFSTQKIFTKLSEAWRACRPVCCKLASLW